MLRERRSLVEFYVFGCEEVIDYQTGAGGDIWQADRGEVDLQDVNLCGRPAGLAGETHAWGAGL